MITHVAGLEMTHEVLGPKSFIHSERSDSTFYSCFAFKKLVLRSAEAIFLNANLYSIKVEFFTYGILYPP